MRARNTFAVQTIKSVLADIQTQTKLPSPPSELKILTKSISQRQDAAKVFSSANPPRQDLADQNLKEVELLQQFVPAKPAAMSDSELDDMVKAVINELGLDQVTGKTMGQVIKGVMAKAAGKADGKSVAEAVKRASQ
ncbi:hypothetical protein OIO90_002274 [Microbotryomycetes sp. JL221]|nr:hypothetical protein OIO90_002274 [Microbotryomycetes sp. JL221]